MITPSHPLLLPAYVANPDQLAVWCPWCGHLHYHGRVPGHRVPHCLPGLRSIEQHPGGYILIPTGEPLPAEAKKLDAIGRRRIRRLLNARIPKWADPQPVPVWGREITDRDYALSLLSRWYWDMESLRGEAFTNMMILWGRELPIPFQRRIR